MESGCERGKIWNASSPVFDIPIEASADDGDCSVGRLVSRVSSSNRIGSEEPCEPEHNISACDDSYCTVLYQKAAMLDTGCEDQIPDHIFKGEGRRPNQPTPPSEPTFLRSCWEVGSSWPRSQPVLVEMLHVACAGEKFHWGLGLGLRR